MQQNDNGLQVNIQDNSLKVNNKLTWSRFLDVVSEALGQIGGFATLLMVVLVTANAISRKLFNWPIPGFYEILGLIGAVFYAFGIVYAAIKGQHIVMNLVITRLPKGVRRVFDGFSRLVMVVFCALFAYAGGSIALQMTDERTADIRIPVLPFRFMVVIALILLALLILAGKEIGKGGDE